MSWSKDYKKSIDCGNPRGFSQKAHCAARKKRQRGEKTKSMSPFNEDVSGVKFTKFGHKTPHLKGKQKHQLDPNLDLKQLVHHATVQYVDRDADGDIDVYDKPKKGIPDENVSSATKAQDYSTKLIKKQKGEMLHTKRGSAFEETEIKYCKLCRKMEARGDCSYGPSMWDKYSVAKVHPTNEAKDHEYSMARSELSTIVNGAKRLQKKMKKGEGEIEAWVQSKITKAADYIDTAADYVDSGEMNKEEVEILEGKRDGKSAKDPGYSLRDWFKGGGWVQAGGKYDGKPCAKQPGQTTKPFCRDADDRASMSKDEREKRAEKKRREDPNPDRKGKANIVREQIGVPIPPGKGGLKKVMEPLMKQHGGGKLIEPSPTKSANIKNAHFEPEGEMVEQSGQPYKVGDTIPASATKPKPSKFSVDKTGLKGPEKPLGEEKDACYKKVKSRYSVWPSAYASGALVKCRKVGAANWGNKTKKEDYDYSNWRDDFKALEIESIDIIKPEPLQATDGIGSRMLDEAKKCWKGYKKAGTQKLFGKTYNRCVKEGKKTFGQFMDEMYQGAAPNLRNPHPALMKIPYIKDETPSQNMDRLKRTVKKSEYLGAIEKPIQVAHFEPEGEIIEDWQKVNKSDNTDGMSPAAVKAYRRENPGSKLKTAVTEKDPGPGRSKRRKSFCARSKGQQDMHNIDCSKTPDKAICKARRRWRC